MSQTSDHDSIEVDVDPWVTAVTDWGVPDWKKVSGYPDTKKFSPWEWAWEFRRRNPDYRYAWAAHCKTAPFDPTKPIDPLFEKGIVRVIMGPAVAQLPERKAAIIINLDVSLDEQLAAASRILAEQFPVPRGPSPAVANVRLRPNEYNLYLRSMDARWEGVAIREIAQHLRKSIPQVHNFLRAGDHLSWNGYFFLARKGTGRPSRKKRPKQ